MIGDFTRTSGKITTGNSRIISEVILTLLLMMPFSWKCFCLL